MGVEPIKLCSYPIEYIASVFATMVAGIAKNVKLYVEEFFKTSDVHGRAGCHQPTLDNESCA